MPTEVYEDSLELEIGLLEAENLDPNGGEAHRRSYPYPLLRPVPGRFVPRTLPTVVLENAYIKATFVPALGGRLLRLFDKGVGREVLPAADRLTPEAGGDRGAMLRAGIQILTGAEDRHGSLADTQFMLDPPSDEDAIGVWFFGLGGDGSFHAHWTLAPDRAELSVEVRTLNRSFASVHYNGGLCADLVSGDCFAQSSGWLWSNADDALLFSAGETSLDLATWSDGRLRIARFPDSAGFSLGPRQVDTWTLAITLASGIGRPTASAPEVSVHLAQDTVRLRSVSRLLGHKALLLVESAATLETVIDLYPEVPKEISLADLPSPVAAFALQDPGKNVLVESRLSSRPMPFERWEASVPPDAADLISGPAKLNLAGRSEAALRRALSTPALRHAARVQLAHLRLAEGDPAAAADELESALLYNAEDPLSWWLRATALRHASLADEDRPELLNAHFLAPLEPALRAEGFLSAETPTGREPSPLLKPLADHPETFLEVACLLLEAGLTQDATKWIDEALRHVDLAMLRYLLADAYLTGSRMQVEAADQIAAAARVAEGPPYPWRQVEVRAIRNLCRAFPGDARLKSLVALIDAQGL